jgi:hypothetical protein
VVPWCRRKFLDHLDQQEGSRKKNKKRGTGKCAESPQYVGHRRDFGLPWDTQRITQPNLRYLGGVALLLIMPHKSNIPNLALL